MLARCPGDPMKLWWTWLTWPATPTFSPAADQPTTPHRARAARRSGWWLRRFSRAIWAAHSRAVWATPARRVSGCRPAAARSALSMSSSSSFWVTRGAGWLDGAAPTTGAPGVVAGPLDRGSKPATAADARTARIQDRKSDVEGKSEHESVDRGGRRH